MRTPDHPAVRVLLVLLGTLGLAWAVTAIADDGEVRQLAELRAAVLEGETFDELGIGMVAAELARAGDLPACATRALEMLVPIRLRLVELALVEQDDRRVRELGADMRRDARKLLSCSPYQSFAWLVLFWGHNVDGDLGPDDFELLRMSLRTGRHESWISRRRNQVALAIYDRLPDDLKEETLDEFRDLAQTTYVGEAARIFVDVAPPPARDRLVERLAGLPAETLSDFAEAVDTLSEGKIKLPGLEQTGPPE